jgi:outer membrane autotransporter protein
MHPVSQLKVFICHAAVGIFAFAAPASAATIFAGADTTITTGATGDDGADGALNFGGEDGLNAVQWTAANVDVILNSGLTFTGGNGGAGGADSANDGGNDGGWGGFGLFMTNGGATVTGSGVFVFGGNGGAGSNGSPGGAADTGGGLGGRGREGILATGSGVIINLTNATIPGGTGGNGGNAGDVAGDAADNAQGGNGGSGGDGLELMSGAAGAVVTLNNVMLTGGNGGAGGASLANATNADGGTGGTGLYVNGAVDVVITLGAGTTVTGGAGGAAGTGGTGGASTAGFGVHLGLNSSLTSHGTILGGGGSRAALFIGLNANLVDNYGVIGSAASHPSAAITIDNDLATLHNRASGLIQSTGPEATIDFGTNAADDMIDFINEGTIANAGAGDTFQIVGSISNFKNSGTMSAVSGSVLDFWNDTPDVIDNTGGVIQNNSATSPTIDIGNDAGADGITFKGGLVENNSGAVSALALQIAGQSGAITFDAIQFEDRVALLGDGQTLNVTHSEFFDGIQFGGGSNILNFTGPGLTRGGSLSAPGTIAMTVGGGSQVTWAGFVTTLQVDAGSILGINQGSAILVSGAVVNDGEIGFADTGKILVNTLSGPGHYRILLFSGATNIGTIGAGSLLNFSGATFEIDASLADETLFADGSNIVLAEDSNGNAIAGVTNGALLMDNSALLDFHLYRGDAPEVGLSANLLVAQVAIALLADIAALGDDPNAIALGAALDQIGLDGDADLDDLMLALAQLPTNEDINATLDALLPETDGIAYDIATDLGDQALDVASKRLDTLLADRLDGSYRVASIAPLALRGSVSDSRAGGRFWMQAFGRAVDQSQHSYNTGYDAGSYGVAVGADTNVDKATALGAAFSYTSTDAGGNGVNLTDTKVDSYQLTLYGDHLFDNALYAKGLLAYGWHANDIIRHDVGGIPGNTATGSYDADHVAARVELGRAYRGGDALTLVPRVHLNAAWYSPDGYAEQGVGGLGLVVGPEDLTSLRLGLGLLARWDIALSGGELFRPELRIDYRRDLTQPRFETAAEFLGAPGIVFRTQGVEPAADILNLGVGALLATAGGVDLRASYDLELKDDYTAHAGYVRASIPF